MKYKPTILNLATAVYLIGILIYTIINYKILSHEEGWGIVAMLGLAFLGVVTAIIDLILQRYIRNIRTQRIIDIIIIIIIAAIIILYS